MPRSQLRRTLATLLALGVGAGAMAQTSTLPKTSPFLPPAGPGQAAAAAGEVIEFAGVSSVGKRTDLVFYDKAAKKSRWVGIGETKDGIELLRYDPRREQAVIKHNGVEKILTLRKGSAVSSTPGATAMAPAPAPVPTMVAPASAALVLGAPPAPTTPAPEAPPPQPGAKPPSPAIPEVQQKQEMEARMLVSDLLEIGMAQRRAYEEAQRKAAESAPANPPPEAPKQP